MATEFYVTGIPAVLEDSNEEALQVGEVAVTLEQLRLTRTEETDALREFEEISGLTPQVFRLVPVGSIWEV